MKLEPGERSILASFQNGPAAEAAEEALRQAGFTEVQFDQVGAFGFDPEPNEGRVALGSEGSQVTATLFGHERMLGDDVRVLLGATPEASGMAGPLSGNFPSFLVTVVTTENRLNEAVEVVHRHGGRV